MDDISELDQKRSWERDDYKESDQEQLRKFGDDMQYISKNFMEEV